MTGTSGNHNILAREQPSTGAITGRYSDGRPIVTFTANAVDSLPTGSMYYVMDYGAVGDGVTLDRTAIQTTLDTCGVNGGGTVWLDDLPYALEAPLQVNYDNVRIAAGSWGAQLIAQAGFLGSEMIIVNAPASGFRYGIRMAEFTINGENVAGVGGVTLTSTYHAMLDHLRVYQCPGTGVFFTGSSAQRGAYTTCLACVVTNGGAGIAYQTNYAENNTIIGGLVAWYNGAGGVGFKMQDGVNQVFGTVFDECDTALWFYFCNGCQVIGAQFTRGVTQFVEFQGATNCELRGCYFDQFVGTPSGQHMINCSSTCAANLVDGCIVNASTGWPGFLNDNSNAGAQNRYTNNQTQGLQILTNASQAMLRGNTGWNPRGASMTQPAVPASGTALTNTYGPDATVVVSGGTVTAIAIGGTATGLTAGSFRVPFGQTITLTYSAAPTWQWWGD